MLCDEDTIRVDVRANNYRGQISLRQGAPPPSIEMPFGSEDMYDELCLRTYRISASMKQQELFDNPVWEVTIDASEL